MSEILEKPSETDKIRMNFWLPNKLFSYVQFLASVEGKTYTEVIRQALREKMDRDPNVVRQPREVFHGD